jgi:myo-inositol-1(or 4)-monophosphatase
MEPLLATAIRAAEAAAAVHLASFGSVRVDTAREKARGDFVTEVDLEAQEAAVSVIRGAYPAHHVLAEEEGEGTGPGTGLVTRRSWPDTEECLWIIDPLDGTTNFLHGHPMFGASVAVGRSPGEGFSAGGNSGLALRGRLEAGAVVAPRTGERWWAGRGQGAWKNGKRISVSGTRDLRRALVGTGFPFKEPDIVPRYAEQLKRVLPGTGGVRRCGSAALDLCYLAEGILDLFWEEDYLSPWDTAAGLIILSEAGGVASRMDGSAIDLENGSILAGNAPEMAAGLAALLATGG